MNRFDIVSAHYQFCVDYHSGQFSQLYKRMCRIMTYFNPGACWRGYDSLDDPAKDIYHNLEMKNGIKRRLGN